MLKLHSLKAYNTFALEAIADAVAVIADLDALRNFRAAAGDRPMVILGEGSNVILASHVHAHVAIMRTRGMTTSLQTDHVDLTIAAGENWHQLVMWSLQQGFYGLENLALIPGSVGAAPVQNIGAYGVELSNLLQWVTAMDLESGKLIKLSLEDCEFGYRDSVFKHQRQRFVILEVTLRLARSPQPNIEYPDLRQELAAMRIDDPTPQDIAEAVIRVRARKLPDPTVFPNVGSFFKNPVISTAQEASLKKQLPELKSFAFAGGSKLAAAQLLDLAGWKQKSGHGVSVWPGQPLVLVNDQATAGESVLQFAHAIQKDVEERYGVRLEIEPDTIGFN